MSRLFVLFAALALLSFGPSKTWSAAVVAGSSQQVVFDNAAVAVGVKLSGAGVPFDLFSSNLSFVGGKVKLATIDGVTKTLSDGDNCFLYLTSHGASNGDVEFGRQVLTPGILAEMLKKSCGDKPTLLIISACFSGNYLRLQHPNVTILTAASATQTSFGCTNDLQYTFWDGCFLRATKDKNLKNLAAIYAKTTECVVDLETTNGFMPSEPQFFQGKKAPTEVPW